MLIDARKLAQGFQAKADICIVGTGAAGITLALGLERPKRSILLLEAGGFALASDDQALYRGDYAGNVPSIDDDYLTISRRRFYGGTTNTWSGYCRTLETIDFEKRDWVPNSGWPFPKTELDPYYDRASRFLGIDAFDEMNPDRDVEELPDVFGGDELFQGKVFRIEALRFGQKYRGYFAGSRNIQLVHHANVVEVVTNESGSAVEKLRVQTLSGIRGEVSAGTFVLATGGIENSRLLLASTSRQSRGVGNQNDLVGRYFMEHPVTHWGMGPMFLRPEIPVDVYQIRGIEKEFHTQVLYLRDSQLRKKRLLTIATLLTRATTGDVVESGLNEFDRAIMRASFDTDRLSQPHEDYSEPMIFHTINMCEQEPNPESRVTLAEDRDALGMPRVKLAWNLTGFELETMYRFMELLRRKVSAAGWGRIKNANEPEKLLTIMSTGYHHMGTTRMHDDPKRGVVDSNCRVHGIENLFVAGSSVFPTSGAANPTFTILALTFRLADHLQKRLGAA